MSAVLAAESVAASASGRGRGSPWDLVRRAAPGPPPAPHPRAAAFADPAFAAHRLCVEAYAASRLDWSQSRRIIDATLRRARSLSSGDRRVLAELMHQLVRHERTLALLLRRAGLRDGASRRASEEGRLLAALVLFWGLPPEAAREAARASGSGVVDGDGLAVDWPAVADPAHTLLGWVHESAPSPAEALGAAASLPDWMAARFIDELGTDAAVELAAALSRRAPLCLRVNRPRGERAALLSELAADGVAAEPSRHSRDGVVLHERPDVYALACVQDGRLEVQDEGSQLVAECVDAAPGMLVVDACAGAGGKSLALASAMEGLGRIVACDVRQRVLDRGLGRSSRARYSCVETVSLPDEGPLPERLLALRGKADRVLVDAPCSGSGSIRRTPHGRWRATERELAELPPRQLAILARTAPLVAPGGRLVYATCSLFRAENEDVVARFLSSEPSFSLLPLDAVLGAPRAASFGDGKFLKLFPHIHDTDGFFAAVLSKA